MASQLGPIIFLLHCLFLLQPSEARLETFHRHKAAVDHGENHLRLRPPVDHRDDKPGLDPEINLFFHYNDLRIGNRIPIYLPREDPSSLPRLLSREESESIPFSTSEFSKILEFFSFPEDSKQARAMRTTLRHCESDPVSGETKFCVSSLESMLDSVSTVFGPSTRFRVLSTRLLNGSISALQNYTILEGPTEIRVSKIVSCHRLPYPYAVFYCHHPAGDNVVHEALIEGDDGRRVEVAATCHMDTSHWNPAHVAFRVLGTRPGGAPVCHFFPGDSLVWLPK